MSPVVNMKRTFLLNDDLECAKFRAAPPALRGHWLALQAYCSRRANGGVILAANQYSDAMFGQILPRGGRPALDRLVKASLAMWDGEDLRLWGYDSESEDSYRRQALGGRRGGEKTASRRYGDRRKLEEVRGWGDASPSTMLDSQVTATAEESGEEQLREGRDGERRLAEGSESLSSAVPLRSGERGTSAACPRPRAPAISPSPPRNVAEGVACFEGLYEQQFGRTYKTPSAESMTLRHRWNTIDPTELPGRMATYLSGRQTGDVSLVGFLDWHIGSDELRGIGR